MTPAAGLALGALLAWLGADASGRASVADEVARLEGHRVTVAADGASYVIDDVAGEGPPTVGVVVRVDRTTLALRAADGSRVELAGPLARPRIAGPGYKVWVLGDATPDGALRVRRIGVLAPPWKRGR